MGARTVPQLRVSHRYLEGAEIFLAFKSDERERERDRERGGKKSVAMARAQRSVTPTPGAALTRERGTMAVAVGLVFPVAASRLHASADWPR